MNSEKKTQTLQIDPAQVLGSSTPVQEVQDTQDPIIQQDNSKLEERILSKGKVSREVKGLGQSRTGFPRTTRKARQVISYAGMIGTAFLSYATSR